MWWKNLRLSGKLLLGFGVVVALLIGVGAWSVIGINGIVDNAAEVIDGNVFRGTMTQREVDHLNWAIGLNKLLTDDTLHELTVETDPRKCAFGEWYYSPARLEAEALMPTIAPLLAQIEEPHRLLHESAVAIGRHYVDVAEELGAFLREKKVDHLAWAHDIKDTFMDAGVNTLAGVELDHTQCSLGQFLYSSETTQKRAEDPEFDAAIAPILDPHQRLHESAAVIAENLSSGRRDEMRSFYNQTTGPLADETLLAIDGLIAWHDGKLSGLNEANRIYATDTTDALNEVQSLLGRIVHTS
ncbi:MAG: CZB domain-containing protein, partial [Spirochaetota bacterium]